MFYFFLSFWQYWVQSLSVHSEHFRAALDFSQNRDQGNPQKHYFICRFCSCYDVVFQRFRADALQYRPKTLPKNLVRSQSDGLFDRKQLGCHIQHPNHPQGMQPGYLMEKVKALQNVVGGKVCKNQKEGKHQNNTPAYQPYDIPFADIRNRKFHRAFAPILLDIFIISLSKGKERQLFLNNPISRMISVPVGFAMGYRGITGSFVCSEVSFQCIHIKGKTACVS